MNDTVKLDAEIIKHLKKNTNLHFIYIEENFKPMIWLFYDPTRLSYILIRRSYDRNNKRKFNHIIISADAIQAYSNLDIEKFFLDATNRIEKGECLSLNNNQFKFDLISNCELQHS